MEWLAALLKWLKGGGNKSLSLTANTSASSQVSTKKGNSQKVVFKNKGNAAYIQVSKDADDETIRKLQEALLPAFEKNEIAFIEAESATLIHDYNTFSQGQDVRETLEFFSGKVTPADLRLIETGLYIDYLVSNNQSSTPIKSGVIARYGLRGKNIVNLASAGYFKTYFKQLYTELSMQNGFDNHVFTEELEKILSNMPFAIFVNSSMSPEEILQEVASKSARNVKYGVTDDIIVIHGYGKNADIIEALLPGLKTEYERVANEVSYRGDLKIIKVTIYYHTRVISRPSP
jgi:hypothetical protein